MNQSDPTTDPLQPKSLAPRRLAKLLSDLNRPAYILDSKDRLRFASSALKQVLGCEQSQLLGLDCSALVPADSEPLNAIAAILHVPSSARRRSIAKFPLPTSTQAVLKGPALHSESNPKVNEWCSAVAIALNQPSSDSARSNYMLVYWERLTETDQHNSQTSDPLWRHHSQVRDLITELRQNTLALDQIHGLIGSSHQAEQNRRQVQAAIQGRMNVLLTGPEGTPLSQIAAAIFHHRRKLRGEIVGQGHWIRIQASLMDTSLLSGMLEMVRENHLSQQSYGNQHRHQETDRDSESVALFIEQIDLLPESTQPLLLSFLKKHPRLPVFATARSTLKSTNHSVWEEILSHLAVLTISIDSLSLRQTDIPALAEAILDQIRLSSPDRKRKWLSSDCLDWLKAYPWPRNHEELTEVLRMVYDKSNASEIAVSDLPLAIRTFPSHVLREPPIPELSLDKALEDFEKSVIQRAMESFPRNRAAVARHLGISRAKLLRRIEALGLDDTDTSSSVPTADKSTVRKQTDDKSPASPPSESKIPVRHPPESQPQSSLNEEQPLPSDTPVFIEIPDEPEEGEK